jgi:hypothetical protein
MALIALGTNMSVAYVNFANESLLLNYIVHYKPGTVLLTESGSFDSAHVLELLSQHPSAMGSSIVIIRLCNNVIDIYEKPDLAKGMMFRQVRQINARNKDDLLSAMSSKYLYAGF